MYSVFLATDETKSHLAFMVYDDTEGDPPIDLYRHEVYCAIRLMMQGLCLDKRCEFRRIPTFIYSFSSRFARIIQCYWSDEYRLLEVRKSKWIFFPTTGDIKEQSCLLLSWMMADPVGIIKHQTAHDTVTQQQFTTHSENRPPVTHRENRPIATRESRPTATGGNITYGQLAERSASNSPSKQL